MRTPKYEFVFDEGERGVRFSDEAWLYGEDDMLKEIEFGGDLVRIITNHHRFELDLRKVGEQSTIMCKFVIGQFLEEWQVLGNFSYRL